MTRAELRDRMRRMSPDELRAEYANASREGREFDVISSAIRHEARMVAQARRIKLAEVTKCDAK